MPCSTPRSKYAKRLPNCRRAAPSRPSISTAQGAGAPSPKRRRRWCGNSARISARGGSRPRPTCWGLPGALFGRGEGVACILGTGSNSCWCRGGEIVENVPPLGYVLGDEGSGAALGRNLVNGIFKGHIPLREEFLAAHGLTYEEIILRVYREPYANRFLASFAPFVHAYLDCPEVRAMVAETFADFAQRNLSRYPVHLTVACIGGVAAAFEGLLREVLAHGGYRVGRIAASPAEGLIKYHYGK